MVAWTCVTTRGVWTLCIQITGIKVHWTLIYILYMERGKWKFIMLTHNLKTNKLYILQERELVWEWGLSIYPCSGFKLTRTDSAIPFIASPALTVIATLQVSTVSSKWDVAVIISCCTLINVSTVHTISRESNDTGTGEAPFNVHTGGIWVTVVRVFNTFINIWTRNVALEIKNRKLYLEG